MFGQLSGYGEAGHSGHAPSLSDLHWNQRWICWRCGCMQGPWQKIILQIINKANFWYLAMITKTCKCNFSVSCLITRHSSIWITNDCIHCSLPSQIPKLAKSGIWHCHLQWQCTRSCVAYMMREWYQWNFGKRMSCSLHIGHMQIFKSVDFRTMGLWIWITFFWYALYFVLILGSIYTAKCHIWLHLTHMGLKVGSYLQPGNKKETGANGALQRRLIIFVGVEECTTKPKLIKLKELWWSTCYL